MGGKIITILVCMLMLSTVAGSLPSNDTAIKQSENETESSNMAYSHDILGEFFTLTTCVPCKYSHRALINLYKGNYHPFEYITMVYDEQEFGGNKWAKQRHGELNVEASPTVMWDGPFKEDKGSKEDIEEDMEDFNVSIIACGNRNVKDIDLNLSVEWLGAVNNDPYDGETLVPIEQHMTWTSSEMEIEVEVTSHETDQYNGHLHVYVTEVNSTLWDDKWGDPYTFAFLDYAWNQDVTISGAGTWDDTVIWDGYEHNTGYPENDQDYGNITQDNIMVIASVFDENNNDYADETTGARTGFDTDPKRYDIYFGNITPPPLIQENSFSKEWFPHDPLNWSETYYWKIDERDQNDIITYGDIWSFTTRGNDPPNNPNFEFPVNESTGVPIEVNLTWQCTDPDGDDLTFDVWFGDSEVGIHQVTWNQTEKYYVAEDLDFMKNYYWYIIAWEVDYDLYTVGPLWNFITEANVPPNPAEDPIPYDGDPAVPTEGVTLEWNGSDDNYGDTLRFDLYFDDVDPPETQQMWEDYDDFWVVDVDLEKYNTYFWRVDTYDREGEFTHGEVWEFSCGDNTPPTNPMIDGPPSGVKNQKYNFTFVSTDAENHTIKYLINWNDGGGIEETNYYSNGTVVTVSHSWSNNGEKKIRAMSVDQYSATTNQWSEFTFNVPRNKASNFKLLELLFARFPNSFLIIQKLLGW